MTSDFIPFSHAMRTGTGYAGIRVARSGTRFVDWYHTIVLALALGIIYSNLPIYNYILRPAMPPKFFFFGLFLLFIPLLLIKSRVLSVYMVSPFALWASLLIILNLVHAASLAMDTSLMTDSLAFKHMEERTALVMTRMQYVVFAWFLGFAATAGGRQAYRNMFIALAVVLPLSVVFDFLKPGVLYPLDTGGAVLGRAGAMFINPTMAAEAILLVFLLGCSAMKEKYRLPLFMLLGVGLAVTFTRSAIIAWILFWPILVYTRMLPRSAMIVASIMLGVALMFIGGFESYLGSRQDFDGAIGNLQARLNFFSSASLSDDSSRERAEVLVAGWDLFLHNPIFGAGAGATQFWEQRGSTHNQLLMLAAEYGVFGVALWVWLVVILVRGDFFGNKRMQLVIAFLFVFMSMFTHQMLDSASYWLATFALVSVKRRRVVVYLAWPSPQQFSQEQIATDAPPPT